jgi:hypothetical protein
MKPERNSDLLHPAVLNDQPLNTTEIIPELVKEVLGREAECRLQVKGYSMSPFIKENDVVTISPVSEASPGFGDVIAFVHPKTEKLLIHRVVWRIGDACLVKGENSFEPDGLIERKDIIGMITRVERDGRKVFFGLGPERFLIALLTRTNLLLPVLRPVRKIFRPVVQLFFK